MSSPFCFGVAVVTMEMCLPVTIPVVIYRCSIVMGHRNCRLVHQAVDGQLNYPFGLTIVGEVLYVADCSNNRVQKFTLRSGEYLGQFGSNSSGEGQQSLMRPYGIAGSINHCIIPEVHYLFCMLIYSCTSVIQQNRNVM